MNDVRFYKILIAVNALIPLGLLAYDGWRGQLGANPIEFFLRTAGVLTLVFLLFTLAVTPLRKLFVWNSLIKYRRMLGLFAFFYGTLHLVTYSVFDRSLSFDAIVGDVAQRPFIAIGMAAFLMLIPLATTSTNGWVKRLGGKKWARLHRLTYIAAILGVIHFWMIVKSDVFYPALFGVVLAGLLVYRLMPKQKPQKDPVLNRAE
ncbi:MAG TPA: protein-methionine-sulfoxide reductase heme-binding subunit MsrQ [Pyrinomonadaceae bacterium]|nr:protein-methionine-sulfoxide reductase heme-binding subunit MsrQ [Pyrinomonadaceae bacterium]